ncbi:hypothetical protein, partial [Tumidithrix helvetica]|uniref:hypothetical protein n=1 Tax=Tumidithrix helvetica TaxID=3457545 RepID=UPI003CC5AF25
QSTWNIIAIHQIWIMTTVCWNKGTFSPRQTYALPVHSGLVSCLRKIIPTLAIDKDENQGLG